jgi:hypothetical protein
MRRFSLYVGSRAGDGLRSIAVVGLAVVTFVIATAAPAGAQIDLSAATASIQTGSGITQPAHYRLPHH